LVDRAVDEAFEIDRAAARVDGRSVEIELHDVLGRDQPRRHAARQEETPGIARDAQADMAEAVDHALVEQYPVGGGEFGRLARMDFGLGHVFPDLFHSPRNCGARLAKKASMPSRKSLLM